MVKIVIPVADRTGETLSAHFGRAPYFAWYVVESGQVMESGVVPNDSEHFGGTGSPPEKIRSLGGEVVVSSGMGIKAIQMFQDFDIAVLQGTSPRSLENVEAFIRGELQELTQGCLHAEHHDS
ncbi:MAG: NifB/NifX family molybdenum-iron cluster-binding protein [Candidatus Bathyarchaeota archaeon]